MPNRLPIAQLGETSRGFELLEFVDSKGQLCSLQASSAIDGTARGFANPGTSFLWLGAVESTRMHLSIEDVAALWPRLKRWVETGSFDTEDKA